MELKQILILVGFAIYYFIRSQGNKDKDKKATPKKRAQQRPDSAPQRSIEDILRDLAGESKPVQREKEIFIEPEKEVVVATENQPRRSHSEPVPTKKMEVEQDDEDGETTFDLRQAVINDAILNRPHHW